MARELSKTMVNKINYTNTLFRSDRVGKVAASGPPSGLVTVGSTENVPAAISYAGVTSAPAVSPPPTLKLPLAPRQTNVPKTAKQPPWNPGARGLDSPLKVNQSVLDNIKKRTGSSKLCNNHYLRGPCAKKDTCGFEHNYKPNAEEKVAISFLARLNPCTNGQECDIADCIYGHHVSPQSCQNVYRSDFFFHLIFRGHQHSSILCHFGCCSYVTSEANDSCKIASAQALLMVSVRIRTASFVQTSTPPAPNTSQRTGMARLIISRSIVF